MIVVIGILAAISVVAYNGIRDGAALASVRADTTNIEKQLELFRVSKEVYPTAINDCPTPNSVALCLSSGSNTVRYGKLDGTTPSRGATGPAYELTVLNDRAFLYSSTAEITGSSEFVKYMDLAPIIDKYGLVNYKLSFDIKSADVSGQNTMRVYSLNGSDARYYFDPMFIPVSTSFTHYELTFKPVLISSTVTASWLAFYGIAYGSGNIPTIRNLKLELAK